MPSKPAASLRLPLARSIASWITRFLAASAACLATRLMSRSGAPVSGARARISSGRSPGAMNSETGKNRELTTIPDTWREIAYRVSGIVVSSRFFPASCSLTRFANSPDWMKASQ